MFLKRSLFCLIILACSPLALATPSIGGMVENLDLPMQFLTKLGLVACYVVGFLFIMFAFVQYRQHRFSPKLVPLTTPILFLLLGLICASIPFVSTLFNSNTSAVARAKVEGSNRETVLPVPDAPKKQGLLPVPKSYPSSSRETPPEHQDYYNPDSSSEEPEAGHWTSDPRYNQ